MRNYGFMPDLQVITSKKSLLSISALYQKYNKDIQTMMTNANPNTDNQSDDNLFVSASWKYISHKYTVDVKSGIISNRIIMTDQSLPDPEEEPVAKNISSSAISEIESKIFLKENHVLNVGINYTNEKGESTGYLHNVSRNRFSLFSTYKIINLYEGLNAAFSLRSEFEKEKIHPLTFSIGSDYSINKKILLKGNISKNYRIPSFNDLYWKSDTYSKGNPDLKPELGYSGELGLNEKLMAGKVGLELSQTAFITSIRDWIIWLPDASGIWSPDNKDKGNSKGIELRGKGEYQKGDSKFDFNGFYTFTDARLTSNDEYNDKQMIYVPKNRMMASIDYSYKRFSANFNFNYIGKRYYDQTHTLPGYQLGNIAVYYDMPIKDNILRASFQINNVWSTKYQAMAWYAMPLRNYQLSLNIKINTKY
jgi:vitamin B12 transporter